MNANLQDKEPATEYVDAHVHVRSHDALRDISGAGVKAVRDAGSKYGTGLDSGARTYGPICISAGKALFKKGGYGSALGVPVRSRNDIHEEIIKLKSAGAGIIKVIASGIVSLSERNVITPGGLDEQQLAAVVQEARSHGLAVMSHANGEQAIIASANAGVRSIEHGFFMTEKALEAMARNSVCWVPTVGALARAAGSNNVSLDIRAYIKELIDRHLEMIHRAFAINVPLAIGTDCNLPDPAYGDAYKAELAYFEQAGLSRDTVRSIAIEGGAKLLGM